VKNHLDFILALATIAGMFAGVIWRIAQTKAQIEQLIEKEKDQLFSHIINVEHQLKIHLTEYAGKKEFLDYHLHALDEKINHKFNRCWSEIKQNQAFLSKHGFVARDDSSNEYHSK
jgi:hypothetical protein